jgi:hypothetical protein
MARKFLDAKHPFFQPPWRRWAVLVVCFGWGGFELANGAPFWAAIFIGGGLYALWELFLRPRGGNTKDKA